MYNILSLIFKYVFIIIIYMFIFAIIRLIYLDIRSIKGIKADDNAYLKLINRMDSLPFKIKDHYSIGDSISLGRHVENDIVLKDPFVSKSHLQIVKDEDEFFLEDLNSANGTFLNGEKVLDAIKLNNGDKLTIGNIEFLFVNRE